MTKSNFNNTDEAAQEPEEYTSVLAYVNPHTKELVQTFIRRLCPHVDLQVEALRGQGVTLIGFWSLEGYQRIGKQIVAGWREDLLRTLTSADLELLCAYQEAQRRLMYYQAAEGEAYRMETPARLEALCYVGELRALLIERKLINRVLSLEDTETCKHLSS